MSMYFDENSYAYNYALGLPATDPYCAMWLRREAHTTALDGHFSIFANADNRVSIRYEVSTELRLFTERLTIVAQNDVSISPLTGIGQWLFLEIEYDKFLLDYILTVNRTTELTVGNSAIGATPDFSSLHLNARSSSTANAKTYFGGVAILDGIPTDSQRDIAYSGGVPASTWHSVYDAADRVALYEFTNASSMLNDSWGSKHLTNSGGVYVADTPFAKGGRLDLQLMHQHDY